MKFVDMIVFLLTNDSCMQAHTDTRKERGDEKNISGSWWTTVSIGALLEV